MDYMDTIPTLDDLRVKSCFICLEEERAPASKTSKTLNPWVHPCPKCALIAHDKCLARWIATLPPKRRPKGASAGTFFVPDGFKCPRCGRPYEFANPRRPRGHLLAAIYETIYVIVSELGDGVCSLAGLVTLQTIPLALSLRSRAVVLSGMFIYEVLFLESYLGPHMFSLLLADKFSDLQRNFFIPSPRNFFILAPTIPFRLLLPGSVYQFIIPLYLILPPILHAMLGLGDSAPLDSLPVVHSTTRPMISTWPPSPALLGLVIVPLVRPVYNRLFSRFRTWVLGSSPPHRQKRYLTDRVLGVFSFGTRRRPAPAPSTNLQDPDPTPIAIADEIIQKDQSSFTHDVVHAIASITLPRLFGNLLWVAAAHSPNLRRFLGLRPLTTLTSGVHAYYPNWVAMTRPQRTLAAFKAMSGLFLGGSWIWTDVDPVWWRNSLGYGIFVLAKDCFELYRLFLQKQQVESRTIKSRDFAGVDVAELDLIAPERFT
ncbi:hypothetical protein FB451DRAFT_1260268 [Mycena latifolia]|nr:hypothetical protein FB451DRAFT_1260268 [Mycena latifolia]